MKRLEIRFSLGGNYFRETVGSLQNIIKLSRNISRRTERIPDVLPASLCSFMMFDLETGKH